MLKPCIVACNHLATRHADAADVARQVAPLNALRSKERLNCVVCPRWKAAPTIQLFTSGPGWWGPPRGWRQLGGDRCGERREHE
eukprot:scaffold52945_cov62-Phaeocystis_antarctica.AAC.2